MNSKYSIAFIILVGVLAIHNPLHCMHPYVKTTIVAGSLAGSATGAAAGFILDVLSTTEGGTIPHIGAICTVLGSSLGGACSGGYSNAFQEACSVTNVGNVLVDGIFNTALRNNALYRIGIAGAKGTAYGALIGAGIGAGAHAVGGSALISKK